MGRHGAEPGMRVTYPAAEYAEASDDGLIAIHRVEEPADRLGATLRARFHILNANLLSKETIVGQSLNLNLPRSLLRGSALFPRSLRNYVL